MTASQPKQIPIPTLYREVNKITDHGIEGYNLIKKYQDPLQMMKSRQLASGNSRQMKKHQTKRGNYLDDQANLHKIVPGPGKYHTAMSWPKKVKQLNKPHSRQTYIQQLMKQAKRQKKPAPGHYNTFKSQKQIDAYNKILKSRKIPFQDRLTYLDHIQYESTQTPGVGAYNPRKRIKTQISTLKTNPQDWRKKHQEQSKKKPVKLPDVGTYNPAPSAYDLFGTMKNKPANKNLLGKIQRFKTTPNGSGLGPGKYAILQEWRGKDKKKKERHGLQVITKGTSKSVYYH